jgi:hypothetical protein
MYVGATAWMYCACSKQLLQQLVGILVGHFTPVSGHFGGTCALHRSGASCVVSACAPRGPYRVLRSPRLQSASGVLLA